MQRLRCLALVGPLLFAATLTDATSAASLTPPHVAAASAAAPAALQQVSTDARQDPQRYPVTKVITLLKDMQQQLEKEAEEDEEVYDKMICWCDTNDRETTAAVQDAQTRIAELATLIETTAADGARLGQEILNHEEDLANSQASLDTATALREKQLAEFTAEERDMLQSIQALEAAIIVLSKHYQGATTFLDRGLVRSAVEGVRYQLQRHQRLLLGAITPRQRRLVLALGQLPAYQPASGEIFGILKQMKETFQANLADSQKDEGSNRKAYEELKSAKMAELLATREALESKRTHLADTDEKNALARQEVEDTRNALSHDEKFILDLKQRCAATKQEYSARASLRQEELRAVAEAINILNGDQARDTFSRVLNPASLLQRARVLRHGGADRRNRAAAVLARAASKEYVEVGVAMLRGQMKAGEPKLAALAVAVRADPMTKVKAAIDKLVTELLEEKGAETKKRESCIERSNENERFTENYQRDQSDLRSKIDGYKATIGETQAELDTINKEVADLRLQIKRKGEDRELENKDFQATVADQREMQTLLTKALQVLRAIYKTTEIPRVAVGAAALMQVRQPEAPPPGFSAYGQSRASGGVVGLLEQIIADTATLETEAVRDEQQAQEEYEDFVKDTNLSIEAKQQQLVNQNAAKSDAEQALIAAEEDLRSKTAELETLMNTASAINLDCEFLVRNFDVRMEARDGEIEALREAKAVLSGMRTY